MSGARQGERADALRRFKPYPGYKDSGVEWLGEIPADWESRRLKYVAPIRVSKLNIKPDDALYVGLENVESWTGRLLLDTQPESVDSVVGTFRAGDVLFGKLRPYLAKAASPDFDGVCTSEVLALRPNPGSSQRYVMYSLLDKQHIRWLDSLTFGTKMPRLSPEQVSSSFAPVPPEPEQRAIAAFLDRETARIDGLVAKKERLIALLQEQRTALITRAVTKGLDPNVPMKASGVEWLGEIPAHWEVKKVKRLFRQTKRQGYPDLTVLSVYRDFGVIEKSSRNDNFNRTPEDLDVYQLVAPGDLVINKMKAWQGSLGVSQHSGITSPDYVVYAPSHAEDGRFLHHYLRNKRLANVYLTMSNGIRPSQWRLEPERFGDLAVFVPPPVEQEQIVAVVDREAARIDALVARVRNAIDRLKELRTALISAAVTGKIDVREEIA